MEETREKILKILLKDFSSKHIVTSLAKEAGLSRVGMWKALKRLEAGKLILLDSIGAGKTSTYSINLNWKSRVLEKTLLLILAEEASKQQRWLNDFAELEDKVDFLIIYGSILQNPKQADDIDILVIANKNNFKPISEAVSRMQKIQVKKIHLIDLTENELKEELKKQNKAYIDALKKGIVLFGQDNYIAFVEGLMKA